jgi:Fic family protein
MDRGLKKPAPPPKTFGEAAAAISASRLVELLTIVPKNSLRGTYFPWDEIRFRTPPAGLTPLEHWQALKFYRTRDYRELPLKDKKGRSFQYLIPEHISEALHQLDMKAGGVIDTAPLSFTEEGRDQYLVTSLMEEAITSSQLEGAAATRLVAREMLRTERRPRDIGERMILNNFLTMQRIRELRHERLTPDLILEIHRRVTDGTLSDPDAAGRFRRPEESVDVSDDYGEIYHVPPVAAELPARLDNMLAFANGETPEHFFHPILRAIVLHFWLAYDHPFVDGNGRTARALFYWSMLRSGYWLFEYLSISHIILKSPAQYARAFLYTEGDDNDLTYFFDYHVRVLQRAIAALHDYIARKRAEDQRIQLLLKSASDLNFRQRSVLHHALNNPDQHYTVGAHRFSHNISLQTARTDLQRLEKLGLFRSFRRGNAQVFVAVENLEAKMGDLVSSGQ